MTIQALNVTITGISPLLMANPQTVDPFNTYARDMKKITKKKTEKTDEELTRLAGIEVRSKVHWDDEIGVYVPVTWIISALCKNAFTLKKISKDKIRGAVHPVETKIALMYRYMNQVKKLDDVVGNPEFHYRMNLKQGTKRIMKSMPIFKDWSFSANLEFENTEIDPQDLKAIFEYAAKYGGFGDFRPTFGRAEAKVTL